MKRENSARLVLNLGSGEDLFGDVRADLFPTKATNLVCDCQSLPFRDEVFSEVYERNLFEHVPNPGRHVEEVKRVLVGSGSLTLITDNAACLKYYVFGTHTGGYRRHEGKDVHFALFTEEHLRNFMANAGLRIKRVKLIDTDYYSQVFDRLVRLVAPSLSYPRIMVEAEKP